MVGRKVVPHLSNPADQKRSSKICVLLVDDNQAFRRAVSDYLQQHHELTLVGAIGSGDALAKAQDLHPQVILVGLDPLGLEIVALLWKVLPDVRIIALTVLSNNTYR